MSASQIMVNGRTLALDKDGYLQDWTDWNQEVATALADADGFELSENHWAVITVLRNYYAEYEIAPPMRALLKLLRGEWQDEQLDSRQLYRLFPQGPAKQACRYAGLPRPVSCI